MTSGMRAILLVLALAGAGLSVVLLLSHHGVSSAAAEQICGTGDGGCDVVLSSRFASIGGWSLAAIGLGFYASMMLLFGSTWFTGSGETGKRYNEAALFSAFCVFALAIAVDVVLLFIQWGVLGSFCRMCLGTYLINAACFGLLWPARTHRPALAEQWIGEGSVTLKSWLLASVILFGMTLVSDGALTAVGEKHMSFLGEAPVSDSGGVSGGESSVAPSFASASGSSGGTTVQELRQELAAARAEAGRLQETLDDPNKLEAYQMNKAAQEFQAVEAQELSLSAIPFKGPAEAPIKVVEFSDFMCPYCRNLAAALAGYLPQSEGRVSVYFKNYPLEQKCNPDLNRTIHIGACDLALGAICAHEEDQFWQYHDAVFAAPPNRADRETVVGFATQAGLDTAKFEACLDSPSAARRLEEDIAEGKRLGVNSTPTIFINGKKLNGVSSFLIAINSEADRLGLR